MLADRISCQEEKCPVSEELLGSLYRADKAAFPGMLAKLEPHHRALLALFCYPRAHLHELGLAIAATCDESDLYTVGGRVGAILYATSREKPQASAIPTQASERRRITLATGQLRQMVPLDDELDDVDLAFAGAAA